MISLMSLTGTNIEGHDDLGLHGHIGHHEHDGHEQSLHDHEEDEDAHDADQIGLSKAEIRKSNKPIMEKRRRARINTCLNELKSLILDALKKDPSRHSKLEKADILEMTVKHLQAVQRQQLAMAVANDPSVLEKFKGGFTECAQEITRYVSRIDGVDRGVRQRLQQHLSNCTNSLNATTPLSFTAMAGLPVNFANRAHVPPPHPPQGDLNNNHARLLHRLVAARLAAAGDTTGAALLLQGGLSLLARGGGAPPSARHISHPYPQQRHPNPHPKLNLQVVNDGASSSRECPTRVSAFTAVKRSLSPPRIIDNPLKTNPSILQNMPKIIAPTAIRPIPCGEEQRKTLVQAQVSLQPVKTPSGEEISSPIDFSFRSGTKRPAEEQANPQRPLKILKVEENIPVSSSSSGTLDPQVSSSVQERSPILRTPPSVKEENRYLPENADGDEKDMWRPW